MGWEMRTVWVSVWLEMSYFLLTFLGKLSTLFFFLSFSFWISGIEIWSDRHSWFMTTKYYIFLSIYLPIYLSVFSISIKINISIYQYQFRNRYIDIVDIDILYLISNIWGIFKNEKLNYYKKHTSFNGLFPYPIPPSPSLPEIIPNMNFVFTFPLL